MNFIKDELLKLSGDIEDIYNVKCDKIDLDSLRSAVQAQLDKSVSLNNLDNLYKTLIKEVNDKTEENKIIVNRALKSFETDFYKLLD